MRFPKCGLPSLYLIDWRRYYTFERFCLFLINWNPLNFKNDRPHFGNPRTSSFRCFLIFMKFKAKHSLTEFGIILNIFGLGFDCQFKNVAGSV